MEGWLADLCQREAWRPTVVVPVPLGREPLRQRGYNQASLVASALADWLDLPMEESALRRVRESRSQVGLDPESRLANVHGAFQADPGPIQGKQALLVDDLFTTGATLAACAEAPTDASAQRV
jgi:ComF family protein